MTPRTPAARTASEAPSRRAETPTDTAAKEPLGPTTGPGGRGPAKRRVLISGASVAGPALAYWLRRYGFQVTVVERAPALRQGGQAIDLRGPAIEVARRMGVLDGLRARATDLRGMSLLDEDGNETFRSTDVTASGGRLDRGDIEILRDDLSRILVEAGTGGAGGEEIEYLFGDSIARLDERADDIRVGFVSGRERTFDVVVGADGVHSRTRALAFGPEEHFLHPLGGCLGVWTAPNVLGLDRWQIAYSTGDDEAWGALVMSVRNNTELRVYAGVRGLDDRAVAVRGPEAQKRLIATRYADAGWELPRLLSYMWEAPDFHFDAGAQIHMDSWSKGRVVLLGDAAHCGSPASGQGSSMALVGAYVLAGRLKAADGDHRAAFPAYERELREWVTGNQALAQRQFVAGERATKEGDGTVAGAPTTPDDGFYAVVDAFSLCDY